MSKKRILTGMKPTGDVHLGNYFGAFRPSIEMSHDPKNEVILLCADWHSLTNRSDVHISREYSHKLISVYLALGFKIDGNAILLQSDFPEILENAWYLSSATVSGLLERSHAYKDALASGKDSTAALLYYPILMAADILTFDSEVVPVGKDQAQHLEYASDMGKLFNNLVKKKVYKEPQGLIQETPLMLGTDGRKMSKSYKNTIPLFAPKKDIEKAVKEIKTDSKGLNDPKDPENCLIFQIFKSFASPDALSYMEKRLSEGTNYGYGHAKKDFLDEFFKTFDEKQKKYDHYLNSEKEVTELLQDGYARCHDYAKKVTTNARSAIGLKTYTLKK